MIASNETIQTADASFFAPITIAYLGACLVWWIASRLRPDAWPSSPPPASRRPWLDVGVALVAAAGVLGVGQLWWKGLLFPERGAPWEVLGPPLNQLVIFSPIFLALWIRRQGPETVFVTPRHLPAKCATGLIAAAVAIAAFLVARGEVDRAPTIGWEVLSGTHLTHFIAVFMEGVALAYLYVRLRWAMGPLPALLVPCVLFAVSHVPRQLEGGGSPGEIALFFAFNVGLPMLILATVARSRDVVWLGIVHYLVNHASGAFGTS